MKQFKEVRESVEEDLQEVNSVMSVDKKNMPKAKPIIQKLARARGVPVEFDKDGIGVTFKGRPKDVEKLMKDFEKNKTLMKLLEANELEEATDLYNKDGIQITRFSMGKGKVGLQINYGKDYIQIDGDKAGSLLKGLQIAIKRGSRG